MTRKIISDMIVTKRSIRQIPLSVEKRQRIEKEIKNLEEEDLEPTPVIRKNPGWKRKPVNPKFAIWLIAGICLLALFFGISIIFSSATVIINPKTEAITFSNETYTAKANSINPTELSFEVLKIEQTVNKTVVATEEKEVSKKASGKIIIYNNYSTAPQRLINNTRFEANNGKIYRINSSVVVPGLKKVAGKVVPGSIEAIVYADQAGEDYNLLLADLSGDFKIPGFKGDVRYQGFYARLKEDIVGGFIGKQRIVSDDLRKETEAEIKLELKEQLLKELYAVKPENYIIFADGYFIDYLIQPDSIVDDDKVNINMTGNLNSIVFNNVKLAKYIATKKIKDFDGLQTELIVSDNLETTFIGKEESDLWKNESLQIKFNGEASIKWLYDTDALKKDLAGKKESDLKNLAVKYQDYVSGIKVIFTPAWTRYFPDDLNKIIIKEESLPKGI